MIEHRAGTREDIAGDIDDYVDPKIIIFDQVIIVSLLSFLLEIILGHQVIFLIYIIDHFEEKTDVNYLERTECLYTFLGLFSGSYLHSGEWCSHGVL